MSKHGLRIAKTASILLGIIIWIGGIAIAAGAKIGTVGSTGNVVGNCLSFAVFEGNTTVDPMDYMK